MTGQRGVFFKGAAALLLLSSAVACDSVGSRPSAPPASGNQERVRPPFQIPGIALDTIATGLAVPWAMAFAPDGRIFLTERAGRIRIIDRNGLQPEPWATFPVFADDPNTLPESGLMGIVLAPDFAVSGHVFVIGTFWKGGSGSNVLQRAWRRLAGGISRSAALPWENRVYRLTDRGGKGVDATVVIDDLPANYYHAGGALTFGPDGMLYLSNGEALQSPRAQDSTVLFGKILRYTPAGEIPSDNPLPRSPVYAWGTRNVQGLAWEPRTSVLFGTDHGPSFLPHEGGRMANDELNVIRPGSNLGWPVVVGDSQSASNAHFIRPVTVWTPGIAPAGLAFYSGPHTPWQGNAFVSGLRGQQLRRVALEPADSTWRVVSNEAVFQGVLGRIRAVQMGPDGFLYFTTSNRDGRGVPAPGDDLVLRLRPLPSTASAQPAR